MNSNRMTTYILVAMLLGIALGGVVHDQFAIGEVRVARGHLFRRVPELDELVVDLDERQRAPGAA